VRRCKKLNGVLLPYSLSDRQLAVVWDETRRRIEEPGASIGKAQCLELEVAIAKEFAMAFQIADMAAAEVMRWSRGNTLVALPLLQEMLDGGQVDALALLSLLDAAEASAINAKQRAAIAKRHHSAMSARVWLEAVWRRRTAGQFQTRDAFVEWCLKNCPVKITVDHDRVRDKWLPAGAAKLAGDQADSSES
jgi:hypothetical protein